VEDDLLPGRMQFSGRDKQSGRNSSGVAVPAQVLQTFTRTTSQPGSAVAGTVTGNDRYTALPARISRLSKSNTTTPTRDKGLPADESISSCLVNLNRRALPNSPPLVGSPKFESGLFFDGPETTAKIVPKTPLKLVKNVRPLSTSLSQELISGNNISPDAPLRSRPTGPRDVRKLQTKRVAVLCADTSAKLPTPHIHEKALPLTPPRRAILSSSRASLVNNGDSSRNLKQSRLGSGSVPSRPGSPKDRFEARRSALDKVDVIVSECWNLRRLRGGTAPASPTMYGAQPGEMSMPAIDERSPVLCGIEERILSPDSSRA